LATLLHGAKEVQAPASAPSTAVAADHSPMMMLYCQNQNHNISSGTRISNPVPLNGGITTSVVGSLPNGSVQLMSSPPPAALQVPWVAIVFGGGVGINIVHPPGSDLTRTNIAKFPATTTTMPVASSPHAPLAAAPTPAAAARADGFSSSYSQPALVTHHPQLPTTTAIFSLLPPPANAYSTLSLPPSSSLPTTLFLSAPPATSTAGMPSYKAPHIHVQYNGIQQSIPMLATTSTTTAPAVLATPPALEPLPPPPPAVPIQQLADHHRWAAAAAAPTLVPTLHHPPPSAAQPSSAFVSAAAAAPTSWTMMMMNQPRAYNTTPHEVAATAASAADDAAGWAGTTTAANARPPSSSHLVSPQLTTSSNSQVLPTNPGIFASLLTPPQLQQAAPKQKRLPQPQPKHQQQQKLQQPAPDNAMGILIQDKTDASLKDHHKQYSCNKSIDQSNIEMTNTESLAVSNECRRNPEDEHGDDDYDAHNRKSIKNSLDQDHRCKKGPTILPDHHSQQLQQQEESQDRFLDFQNEIWKQHFQELVACLQEQRQKIKDAQSYQQDNPDHTTQQQEIPQPPIAVALRSLTHLPEQLTRWVKRQRYQYKLWKKGKPSAMDPVRYEALKSIGFIWSSQDTLWWDRFAELVEFKQIHQHCNVPSNYAKHPGLAVWVKSQRHQYKLFALGQPSNMTAERIGELNRIDFRWVLRSYHKQSR